MRARLRDSVCLLIATALAFTATAAGADELLVMPYSCSVVGGEVVLRPSRDEGHRIVSRRENREFTACSPVDPSMCRKWEVHSFEVDCGGERVPWTSVVAAADRERSAWVENGRLQIRMPPWWTEGGRAGAGAEIVQMPYGFAPRFGIDAAFVTGDGQQVAGDGSRVGGYESRTAPGAPPPRPVSGRAPPDDSDFAVAPGSALPPLGASEPGASSRRPTQRSRDIPFEIKPPEEGLTVERAPAPDESEPFVEPRIASMEPSPEPPEPEATWREPPPLPQRLDPTLRREMARGLGLDDPVASETEMARAPAVPAAQAELPADRGTPAVPAIINSPADAASVQATASGQQPGGEASSTGADATLAAAGTAIPPAPVVVPVDETPPVAAAAPEQFPAFSNEANAPERTDPQGLMSRVLSGEPAAVAVAVITGGLLAILILGLSLTRRRQADLPDLASRDISSVSLEKGSHRPQASQASPGAMMHDLSAPNLDARAAGAPAPNTTALSTPTLSGTVGDVSPRRRAPDLAATQTRRDPGAAWGEAIPKTHAEALRVLGMGVTREASPASIKKVVDGLRMSWHPDYAKNEADRNVRELRMKQINAAWEIISGTRAQQPESQPARRPEKLHQL